MGAAASVRGNANATNATNGASDEGPVRFGLQVCSVPSSCMTRPPVENAINSFAQASELLQEIGIPSHMIKPVPVEFSEDFAALKSGGGFWTRVIVGPYISEEDAGALIQDPEKKLAAFAPDACVVEFPRRSPGREACPPHLKKRPPAPA